MSTEQQGYITDVVYTDNYYEELSPLTINYLAALNGVRPRALADFDYCEIGCGQGLSLLVHAATHPGGRFVGIDLNAEHIRHAEERAAEAELGNLRLIAEPVSDELAASGLADFDFIVLHGVYSYLPEAARQCVHRFIDRLLKPGGLVLISYNAEPGWLARKALCKAMRRFALPRAAQSLERAQLGLSYLRLMLNARAPIFQLNPELERYAESLFSFDPHYIAHEFFHENHDAFAVDDVAAAMNSLGLAFTGTLPLWQNHPQADVPENMAEFFSSVTDRVTREAHKDFIYNTVFRTDLYARPSPHEPTPSGSTECMWDMSFSATTRPAAVQLEMRRGALQLPLNTRESRTVFGLLEREPRTAAALSAEPALSAMTPDDLVHAVWWWVLSGQVRPTATHDLPAAAQSADRLNRVLLARAMRAPQQDKTWLASPRFGNAFEFGKSEALAICSLAGTADASPGQNLWALMQQCGLHVQEDDTALGADQISELARELHEELEANGTLEQVHRLGITP